MADEGDFNNDEDVGNDDIDEEDDDIQQGEEYTDEELEEQEPELKKEEEDPCDYEVYDGIEQESDFKATQTHSIPTSMYLNKYEMARVLGIRTEMLNRDAPPMIDVGNCIDTFEIAKRELKAGLCPLGIVRTLPNGTQVYVPASRLLIRGI